MKKLFSLLTVAILLSGFVTPLSLHAADSAEADKALHDLLADLEGTENSDDAFNGETQSANDAIEEAKAEVEEAKANVDEAKAEVDAMNSEHEAAEDILDDIEGDNRSFAGAQKIEVMDIKDTMVTISTTEVLFDGASINKYNIFYSLTTLSDTSNFDSIESVEVDVEKRANGMVHLKLENLTPETKYYVTVTPVHPTDPTADGLKMTSSEVTFNTEATAPVITSSTKVFENVSFTQNKNALTISWTPTEIVKNGSLQVRHKDDSDYTKVGTVSMNTGKYTFTVNKPGSYFLKLHGVSDNGDAIGQEQVQNIKVEAFEQLEAPVQAAPQVGPTTDLIMMLFILAMITYFIYRFRRIER